MELSWIAVAEKQRGTCSEHEADQEPMKPGEGCARRPPDCPKGNTLHHGLSCPDLQVCPAELNMTIDHSTGSILVKQ